ncbi:hypothetical protein GCM10023172_18080 [Hymenobacter ginsengisoli]|uniref:Uncharacterized protein n=1 Tax=Hymenobacter ginsengisoli TaxID=1051626 RepID=A0ABP8QAR7_9BACT|nr:MULTISPECIES: hypothetical protein [unclassified Hymenobacter]MBO2031632.1 hypothetical protein [Hymenobacter sp. BT559]
MSSNATNRRAAQQARARRRALTPSDQDMQLLSSYVFGHITLEEANELLHERGPFIIAICDYELATA